VLVADLDLDARRDWLTLFPFLTTRRPDTYAALTAPVDPAHPFGATGPLGSPEPAARPGGTHDGGDAPASSVSPSAIAPQRADELQGADA
jgi:N-carbamoylputrescine amidase